MDKGGVMKKTIQEHIEVIQAFDDDLLKSLNEVIVNSVACLEKGGKLIFCGNGGSAADAQHLAAEFVVRFQKNRAAMNAVAITTDTSILTACSNDFGYNEIFARQIEAIAKPEDIIFLITTSGTSENVVKAMATAKKMGLQTVAVTGDFNEGIGSEANIWWRVPSKVTARIQEAYMLLGHILCEEVEKEMFEDEEK